MTLRGCIAALIILSGCGRQSPPEQIASRESAPAPAPAAGPPPSMRPQPAHSLDQRLAAIDAAVADWRGAPDLATARRNAEAARNLIVGPSGPFYGDADGDGGIAGASSIGLLPGLGGEPGLASAAPSACVTRDLLGGDWSDPARRWQTLRVAIANWRPGNNTFPKLPSHAQRIVGWATLALAAKDLATAREYAGHARIHVDVSTRAARACAG